MAATWHAVKSTLSSVKGNVVPDPVDPVMMHEHVSDRVFTSKNPPCMFMVPSVYVGCILPHAC